VNKAKVESKVLLYNHSVSSKMLINIKIWKHWKAKVSKL